MSNVDKVNENKDLTPAEELALLKAKKAFKPEDVKRITELQELILLEQFEKQREAEVNAVEAKHSRSVVRETKVLKSGAGKGITIKQY